MKTVALYTTQKPQRIWNNYKGHICSIDEFRSTKDYNFNLFQNNSAYTDDIMMTLAVACWLRNDKEHNCQGLENIMVMFGEKCTCAMCRNMAQGL